MEIFLDYEKFGTPHREDMVLDAFIALKAEIKKTLEKYGNKYDAVNLIISIKQDGLTFSCIATDKDLVQDLNDVLSQEVYLSGLADKLSITKSN